MTGEDYSQAISLIRRHVNVIVCDCGTGLLDSATQGVLRAADHLVVVLGQAADVTDVAARTYAWLEAHGHGELAKQSVAVLNNVDPSLRVNREAIEKYLANHARTSVRIPRDPQLASGARAMLSDLQPATRRAYKNLAASVVHNFRT